MSLKKIVQVFPQPKNYTKNYFCGCFHFFGVISIVKLTYSRWFNMKNQHDVLISNWQKFIVICWLQWSCEMNFRRLFYGLEGCNVHVSGSSAKLCATTLKLSEIIRRHQVGIILIKVISNRPWFRYLSANKSNSGFADSNWSFSLSWYQIWVKTPASCEWRSDLIIPNNKRIVRNHRNQTNPSELVGMYISIHISLNDNWHHR